MDKEFDVILRRKIGQILGETIDESIDADDLRKYRTMLAAH